MNTFKKLIITILTTLLTFFAINSSVAQIQNRFWVFPPYYVDMLTGEVDTLPNSPLSKNESANGILGENDFKFYVTGDYLKDKSGNLEDPYYSFANYNDFLLIPNVNECNEYYYLDRNSVYTSYDDIEYLYENLNKIKYYPSTNEASITGTLFASYASGFTKSLSVSSMIDGTDIHILTATIRYSTQYGNVINVNKSVINSSEQVNTSFVVEIPTNASDYPYIYLSEGELSHDGRFFAFTSTSNSFDSNFKGSFINIIDLNTCSGCSYTSIQRIKMSSGSTKIGGLEFSADNNRLFFATQGGNIKYLTKSGSTWSYNSSNTVSNSSGVANSQIELAYNGLMYTSNGSSLFGFDPQATSPSIIDTIANVPNTTVDGVYTLVDQLDGYDYTSDLAYGCIAQKTIDNVGTNVASVSTTDYIETLNEVTVASTNTVDFSAGNYITFNPGFTASQGAVLSAKLDGCTPDEGCEPSGARMARDIFANNNSNQNGITLYPNPSSGDVFLDGLQNDEIAKVNIYTNEGAFVKSVSVYGNNHLDLNSLNSGIYLAQVISSKGTFNNKIVIE